MNIKHDVASSVLVLLSTKPQWGQVGALLETSLAHSGQPINATNILVGKLINFDK